jgi:AraC-like DNA-binding protein
MPMPLADAFRRGGGDVSAVLARNGLPVEALTDPTALLDARACYLAIEDMAEILGDRYFAARAAIELANRGTPFLRKSAQSTTLAEFFARLISEVREQVNNVSYQLTVTSEAASLEVVRRIRVARPLIQGDAIPVAFYVTLLQRGIGSTFDPGRIVVSVPNTAGIPRDLVPKHPLIRSDTNTVTISFPSDWLWARLSLGWTLADTPRGEFGPSGASPATLSYFREILKANIDQEDLSLDRFAAICGIHPRRLQRIVTQHGTTFRGIRDEVRQSVAKDLLANTDAPIAQVAAQVGLSGASALDRAFKQWTGKSPKRFRLDSRRGD